MTGQILDIPVAAISVGQRRRSLEDVTPLVDSIREVGLLHPIAVVMSNGSYILSMGAHRLEACRRLGWETIPATILTVDDLHRRLAEIDENIARFEMRVLERAEWLSERKSIYLQLHPETKRGAAGGKATKELTIGSIVSSLELPLGVNSPACPPETVPSFVADTAAKTGKSEANVKQDVQIATGLSAEVRDTIRETELADNKTELLELARIKDKQVQAEVARRVTERTAESVRKAKQQVARETADAQPLPSPEQIGASIEVADALHLPLSNDTVDLIVTSPPYAAAIAYADGGDIPAADWQDFMRDWLAEALRVTKPRGRLALNVPLDMSRPCERPTYAQAVEAATGAGWLYKFTVVWHERNTTKGATSLGSVNSAARPHHVSPVEVIAVLYKDEWGPSSAGIDDITASEWQDWGKTVWDFPGESSAWEQHPAPYPVELPRRLIRYLSRVGDTVLDPFCGSGASLVAARSLGRVAIGFDRSETYVRSARRRLASLE